MLARILLAVMLLAPFVEARERAVLIYPRERSWFRRIFYTSHQRALRARIEARYETDVHEQVASEDELFAVDVDVDGAKLLVLSAHGDAFSMYFAGRGRRTLDSTEDDGVLFSRQLVNGELSLSIEFDAPGEYVLNIEPPLLADMLLGERVRVD